MRITTITHSQTARRRFFLALGAFTLIVVATLSLVGYRASAADLRAPAGGSAIAEQTETAEDGTPAATPAWAILEWLNAAGLLPEQATRMMGRAVLEHSEARHPGRSCERILQAGRAAPEVMERCRAALAATTGGDADSTMEPGQVCRRALQTPAAVQTLIERCRVWAGNASSGDDGTAAPPLSAAEACRRIASADAPVAELVERCRAWFANQAESGSPTARELCARILAADAVPEALIEPLIERCEALSGPSRDAGQTVRPDRSTLPERPGRG